MSNDHYPNIAQTIGEFVESIDPVHEMPCVDDVVAMPQHYKVEDLERFALTPRRAKAEARLTTLQGFSDYVNRHRIDNRTAVYVTSEEATGVIDDLEPQGPGSWKDHTAILPLRRTPQWSAWMGASGQPMKQREFLNFVQDRAGEIAAPDLGTLMHQLSEIKATSTGKRHDRADHLNEAHGREGSTIVTNDLPEHLDLLMPILSCEPYSATTCRARLVVKLADEGVFCSVTLINSEVVVDERIRELVAVLRSYLADDNGQSVVPVFF